MSSTFNPEPAGTLMPDGTRWGGLAREATVKDDAGLLASPEVELIASGFRWTEGPTWVASQQALFFSDTISENLYKWTAEQGVAVACRAAGGFDGNNVPNFPNLFEPGPNGMVLNGEDQLIICQHPTARVVRVHTSELNGRHFSDLNFEILASKTPEGRRLNAPNDVIMTPTGDVLFTDPVYGFLLKSDKGGYGYLNSEEGLHPGACTNCRNRVRNTQCLPLSMTPALEYMCTDQSYLDECVQRLGAGYTGVYRWRRGEPLVCIISSLPRPNGLALSRDGRLLWVANSAKDQPSWTAFDVSTIEGANLPLEPAAVLDKTTIGNSERLFMGPGLSDGFKVDEEDRIWSSCPGGLAILDPQSRTVVSTIDLGTNTSNVVFGDHGDVFVTGLGHLWRLKRRL